MTYSIGQRLDADDLNNPTPSGDMTLGDDLFLATGSLIQWGSDTNLYRGAADQLKTDDDLKAKSFRENSGALVVSDRQNTSGTTTSTTYVATLTGGTTCGFVFNAPASGEIMIHNKAWFYNNMAGFYSYISYEIRAGSSIGSGTVFQATSDANANLSGSQVNAQGVPDRVTGLTPGATYNIRQMFKVDGNTGTFLNKILIVVPCP